MPSKAYLDSLHKVQQVKPQTRVEVVPGMTVRLKTDSQIPVLRIHYAADSDRDPKTETGKAWRKSKRKEYASQAEWDREMEIVDAAGGGERLYAETLTEYFSKIVITDPSWRPGSTWKSLPGFDYGKTNPTAALDARIDHEGTIYFVGEYYQPGMEIWEHAPILSRWLPFAMAEEVVCDPSIFDKTMQDRNGKALAIAEIYYELGIRNLRPFLGNRTDILFEQRLKMHWANLSERAPTVKIWCPGIKEIPDRPIYGLHAEGCFDFLWELANIRRVKMTATQLMTKNPSEAVVDKDNHLADCFAAGTLIITDRGEVPIESVTVDDRVLTREGWRQVEHARQTYDSREVYRLLTDDGRELKGTGNHPIFIRGHDFVPLDSLKYGMMLECRNTVSRSALTGWESTSTVTQKVRSGACVPTIETEACTCILSSGSSTTGDQSRRNTTFITRTRIRSITSPIILRLAKASSIWRTTRRIVAKAILSISNARVNKPKNGTVQPKGERGILSTVGELLGRSSKKFASNVALTLGTGIAGQRGMSFALEPVGLDGEMPIDSITLQESASDAARNSSAISLQKADSADECVRVRCVEKLPGRFPVWNLAVQDCPEFFANGILVHNCAKYQLLTLPEPTAKTREQRIQEAIAPMIESRDFTNAAIRVADLKYDMDHEDMPIQLGTRNQGRPAQMVRLGSRFGRRR
jgi:hypothetical protein